MSLKWKAILGIALIEAVFLAILILNALSIFKDSYQTALDSKASTLARLFSAATKDAVISTDIATLQSMIDELMSNPSIVFVKVYDSTNLLGESYKSREEQQPLQSSGHLYTKSIDITIDQHVFGKIEFGLDVSDFSNAYQNARDNSIRIAAIEMAAAALVSLLFGTYLTHNLTSIRRSINAIKSGSYGYNKKVTGNDELAETLRDFNNLSIALQQSDLLKRQALDSMKTMAARLQSKEQWLQAVINNIVDGILTLDSNGNIQSINLAAEKMLGYGANEMIGHSFDLIFLDERQRHRIKSFISEAQRSQTLYSVSPNAEELGYRRDGQSFPLELTISYTCVENQVVVILFLRDLTQQRVIENRARVSDAIKTSMLDFSLSAIISVDKNNQIKEFNPSAEAIFGYSREEALNSDMSELIMPERFRAAHKQGLKRYLSTGVGKVIGQRLRLFGLRKTGEEFPIELTLNSIQIDEEVFFTAVIDDITQSLVERKELEDANKAAKSANLAKSQFLASMSHEIRTPLNIILGMINLLGDTRLSAEQSQLADSAKNAGEHLLNIVTDILDLTKIEAGQMSVNNHSVNIVRMIEDCRDQFLPRAHAKNIEFHIVIEASVPATITSDPVFLRQILMNLLSNAIKFTEAGCISIHMRMDFLKDVRQLCIEVKDTGEGILESQQHLLFKEFSQIQNDKNPHDGTGLGLVISRHLAKLLNGDILCTSYPNAGSTFTLVLNLPGAITNTGKLPLVNKHFIIISSSDFFLDAMSAQLTTWGGLCVAAKTESAVAEAIKNCEPNTSALLLDRHHCQPPLADNIRLLGQQWKVPLASIAWTAEELNSCEPDFKTYAIYSPYCQFNLLRLCIGALHRQPYSNDRVKSQSNLSSAKKDLEGMSILIVEDSESNQIVIRAYLERYGCMVTSVNDGQKAINLLRQQRFDIILMDIRMPVLNGIDATGIIRRNHLADGCPIIALTAHALASERDNCLKAGMDDFITKPINPDLLFKTLMKWNKTYTGKVPRLGAEPALLQNESADQAVETEDNAEPLINQGTLEQLIIDTSLPAMIHMLGIFQKETLKRADLIDLTIQTKDYERLETHLHTLKSSAMTFGAPRLSVAAETAEASCKEGNISQAIDQCRTIRPLINATLEVLRELYADR